MPHPATDIVFCLSSNCPHCPAMLQILSDMVKQGEFGRLEIINVEARPEVAASLGVRTVPWLRIGRFELTGLRSRQELAMWLERCASPTGMADYFHDLLRSGELGRVLAMVHKHPEMLADLVPIVANPEASINVRVGAGAVFEEFAGMPAMQALVASLGELSEQPDRRVRADACHYLGLTGSEEARAYLEKRLEDEDGVVREIAAESLEELEAGSAGRLAG